MMDKQINHKITQAFERISKTFRVLLWEESKKYKISPIQIQVLIFCLTHKEEMLKVSLLAKEFDLTKPTMSNSIKTLIKKGFIIKVQDTNDSRSHRLRLTIKGEDIAQKTSSFTESLDASISSLKDNEKGLFLNNLLNIIEQLNKKSVISIQRMCLSCRYYRRKEGIHYCQFLKKDLDNNELQIDCSEYQFPV